MPYRYAVGVLAELVCSEQLRSPTRISLNLFPHPKSLEHSCPRPFLFFSQFCIPYLQGSNADHARMYISSGHLRTEHAGQPCGEALREPDAVCSQMEAFIRGLELPKSLHWCEVICHSMQTSPQHPGSSSLLVIQVHGSKIATSEERVANWETLVN